MTHLTVRKVETMVLTFGLEQAYQCLVNSGVDSLEILQMIMQATQEQEKVNMKQITIVWIDDNMVFNSWKEANVFLQERGDEHDKDGFNDTVWKTNFKILWEDGHIHAGRLEINSKRDTNLGEHVMSYLKIHTGEHCPRWMTEEYYKDFLRASGVNAQDCSKHIETYNIVL